MANYIDRQAAIEELAEQIALCDKALNSFGISMKDEYAVKVEKASLVAYREQLEALPPADVVPVVRCRNCARLNRNGYCTRFQNNISGIATSWFMPDDDDFCSYGERKE